MIADETVGRVKTVWMSHENQAIISTIIAKFTPENKSPKLFFDGPVNISEKVKRHLQRNVLNHVNDIISALSLQPMSFTVSAVNIGAASSSNLGTAITGFSLDVSVFMALLSSALNLPVRQNTVFTGHIGSNEGDILPVDKLEEKCNAAVSDTNISQFVYPNLDSDISLKSLKPNEYNSVIAAIKSCRGRIKLYEVSNTIELFQKVIETKAIIHAALRSGFFDYEPIYLKNDRLKTLISYLTKNNHQWYWKVLEENLLGKDINSGHELMKMYSIYYNQKKQYPRAFGEKLYKLVISLPPYIRKTPGIFPLLPKKQYINLIQYALPNDEDDISYLHNALYGEIRNSDRQAKTKNDAQISKEHKQLLDHILEQLDPAYVDSSVISPYDEARAKYSFDSVTIKNNEEFVDAITAFYTHLYLHTNKIQGSIEKNLLGAEALHILKETFKGEKGYKEVLANARDGRHGGLRDTIDKMTEYLKDRAKEKHILKTFKENIDPNDYQTRVNLIKEIINRSKDQLPEEILLQPPERFADDPEEIIIAFIKSKTVLKNALRRL